MFTLERDITKFRPLVLEELAKGFRQQHPDHPEAKYCMAADIFSALGTYDLFCLYGQLKVQQEHYKLHH